MPLCGEFEMKTEGGNFLEITKNITVGEKEIKKREREERGRERKRDSKRIRRRRRKKWINYRIKVWNLQIQTKHRITEKNEKGRLNERMNETWILRKFKDRKKERKKERMNDWKNKWERKIEQKNEGGIKFRRFKERKKERKKRKKTYWKNEKDG